MRVEGAATSAHAFNRLRDIAARKRQLGWCHQGIEVWRLGQGELREVYDGFTIANHTLTHPHLEHVEPHRVSRRPVGLSQAGLV
jgi:hypothetical protein